VKWISYDDLVKLYLREKNGKVKMRLLIIIKLYEGHKLYHVSKELKMSVSTVSKWLKRWNQGGYAALLDSKSRRKQRA